MAESAYPAVVDEVVETPAPAPGQVTFPELVHAHFRWRKALRAGEDRQVEDAYRRALAHFERHEGKIVNAYWCSSIESAVALTEQPAPRHLRWLAAPRLKFHRVSDWATKGEPAIAVQMHECDELAVRATHVLSGVRRQVCMQLVMAAAGHLLSLVDARAAHADEEKTKTALAAEQRQLQDAKHYYREAANGQAQMVYFGGMALAAAVIAGGLGCGLWVTFGNRDLFGAMIAGAIGAVVSVIQRINAGTFELEFDVGRPYLVFLGALRPAIGAVFGMAVSLAVTSDIVSLPGVAKTGDARFAALLVLTFFAGFSERWAQDTLATALPGARQKQKEPQPSAGRTGPSP